MDTRDNQTHDKHFKRKNNSEESKTTQREENVNLKKKPRLPVKMLCKKQFQYSASLRAHLIRHTRKVAPSSSSSSFTSNEASGTSSEKGRTKREFICSICGRTLPKLYSLRIHMLKHTGVKPHACQVCGKTFIYKHGLKLHQSLHQSQKQFQCELCVKSFVTKRSLQEHMSIHTVFSQGLWTQQAPKEAPAKA